MIPRQTRDSAHAESPLLALTLALFLPCRVSPGALHPIPVAVLIILPAPGPHWASHTAATGTAKRGTAPTERRPSPHLQQVPRRLRTPAAAPEGPYSFFSLSLLARIHLHLYCRARCSTLILGTTPCTSSWLHHSTINLHLLPWSHSYTHSHSYSYSSALPHFLEIVFAIPSQSELIDICVSSI